MFSHFTVDDYHLNLSPDYANTTWNNPAEDTDLATPLCCSDVKAVPSYVRLLYFFWPSAYPQSLTPLSLSVLSSTVYRRKISSARQPCLPSEFFYNQTIKTNHKKQTHTI